VGAPESGELLAGHLLGGDGGLDDGEGGEDGLLSDDSGQLETAQVSDEVPHQIFSRDLLLLGDAELHDDVIHVLDGGHLVVLEVLVPHLHHLLLPRVEVGDVL